MFYTSSEYYQRYISQVTDTHVKNCVLHTYLHHLNLKKKAFERLININ